MDRQAEQYALAGRRPRSHKQGRGNSASHLAQWRGISGFLSFQNRQSLSTCLVEASFWQRGHTAVPLRVPHKTAPCQTARMPARRSGRDLCLWTSRLGTVQSTPSSSRLQEVCWDSTRLRAFRIWPLRAASALKVCQGRSGLM